MSGILRYEPDRTGKRKVTKSNKLVEARYKLTLNEQRLILTYISMLTPDGEEFPTVRIKVRDLIDVLELDTQKYYHELKGILKKLRSRVLEIPMKDGYVVTGWIDMARYYEKKGEVEIRLSKELKPYLLKLKEAFTTYALRNVLRLRSSYSIRFYELLKQYEKIGRRRLEVEELRGILKIEPGEYSRYNDFKRFVILPAKKELEEKTDISFEFEEIKKGRKVVALEFIIKVKGRNRKGLDFEKRYRELKEDFAPLLEGVSFRRLTEGQVLFFLLNSQLPPEKTLEALLEDDRNTDLRNPVGTLMVTIPLKNPREDTWLLKYSGSGCDPDWWKEEFERKLSIVKRYMDVNVKPPGSEEEAAAVLKDLQVRLAKRFWRELSPEKKRLINRSLEGVSDRNMKTEIKSALVLKEAGIESLSLYS